MNYKKVIAPLSIAVNMHLQHLYVHELTIFHRNRIRLLTSCENLDAYVPNTIDNDTLNNLTLIQTLCGNMNTMMKKSVIYPIA